MTSVNSLLENELMLQKIILLFELFPGFSVYIRFRTDICREVYP